MVCVMEGETHNGTPLGVKKQGLYEDCVRSTVYVFILVNTVECSRMQKMVISHGCGHPVSG